VNISVLCSKSYFIHVYMHHCINVGVWFYLTKKVSECHSVDVLSDDIHVSILYFCSEDSETYTFWLRSLGNCALNLNLALSFWLS